MRVAVVGGGPGGLFLATLLRRADPGVSVTVFERNRADDTFGFGVVFSDRTLASIHAADPVLRRALESHGVHWDDIEVRLKGERLRCGGNGMTAISRRVLLSLLQDQARSLGAVLHFETEVDLGDLTGYDLVVAADGTGSRLRDQLEPAFASTVETASAKFIWFGTDYLFDGLTFVHQRSPHGVFAVHGYPIGPEASTFIVETDEATWRAAGLDGFDQSTPPGPSDQRSKSYLEALFAEQIEGAQLLVNNSRWSNFRTRRTGRWHVIDPARGAVVLLGDAAHTAHFSVGSGTKMAMEDAVALSSALVSNPGDIPAALRAYEAAARPSVEAIQASARPSLSWWEHFGLYHDRFEPWQFAYHFLSRSIGDARLARRAPEFVAESHRQWLVRWGSEPLQSALDGPLELPGRVALVEGGDTSPTVTVDGGGATPLCCRPPSDEPTPGGGWAGLVISPPTESGLPAARERVEHLVAAGASLVAVEGGTELTRTLVSEHARLVLGVPSLLIEPGPEVDLDAALTAVLSGRADLVGVRAQDPKPAVAEGTP